MSEALSVAEFARRAERHERQVRRAISRGGLIRDSNGLLDSDQLDSEWCKTYRRREKAAKPTSDKSNVRANVRTIVRGKSRTSGPITSAEPELPQDIEDQAEAFIARVLRGDYATQFEADRVKANALALKHVLGARREAGRTVDIETAETVLFESARISRDAWLNFPSRVGPTIAAKLGTDSDKLVELLATHVHQQLSDLGEPEGDFRGDAPPPPAPG